MLEVAKEGIASSNGVLTVLQFSGDRADTRKSGATLTRPLE